jgi:hypothetical protein
MDVDTLSNSQQLFTGRSCHNTARLMALWV